MKVQVKIAGPEAGTVPLEAVAAAVATAQATVLGLDPGRDPREQMKTTAPMVHSSMRRVREAQAYRLLLDDAQHRRLRVCDPIGVEGTVADLVEAAARDGLARFKPLDDETRKAMITGSKELEPGCGVSVYQGPPLELVPDPEATQLAALHTTPGWLAAWGRDRGFEITVEFSGVVMTTVNGWGGVPRRGDRAPEAEAAAQADTRRMPLMQANRQRVLEVLRAAGYDPQALPPLPRGRSCPAKAAARAVAGLSRAAFNHAWGDLSEDGELCRQR